MGPGCAAPSVARRAFSSRRGWLGPTGETNHDADLLICKPVKYGR
jgi:hypothetical protein